MNNFIIKEYTIKSECFTISLKNTFTFDEECDPVMYGNF